MKNTIFVFAIIGLLISTMFISCESQSKKEKISGHRLQTERNDNKVSKMESMVKVSDTLTEFEKFKKVSEFNINALEKSISEYTLKIARAKKVIRMDYESKLAVMNKKNMTLKKELEMLKEDSKGNWLTFKIEFNKDLDDLNQSFEDLSEMNSR